MLSHSSSKSIRKMCPSGNKVLQIGDSSSARANPLNQPKVRAQRGLVSKLLLRTSLLITNTISTLISPLIIFNCIYAIGVIWNRSCS